MKVLVRGPALTRTGYGEHCRFVLRALKQASENIDIYLIPVNWGQSNWIWENNEEREWLDQIIRKTAIAQQQNMQYDTSIQITIPNEWQMLAPVNIGITAGIETTKISPLWLEKANLMDKIITISEHSKHGFTNTVYEGVHKQTKQKVILKCETPVDIVHYPVKNFAKIKLDLDLSTKFNFLTVAQWGPRKNLANTIRWFVEEFIDNSEVGLVVKTFSKGGSKIDKKAAKQTLTNLLREYSQRQCKIYLLHGDMSEEEIHSLYKHKDIKAFISLSHGEGFGLPHFEAAYSGLPVIAPEWSGYLDFLCMPKKDKKGKERIKPHFATVDYDLQPVQKEAHWEGVIQSDSLWCFAKQGSYKMKLREVYKDHGRFVKQAKVLQKWIHKNFKMEDQYKKMINCIIPQDKLELEGWLESLDAEVHG